MPIGRTYAKTSGAASVTVASTPVAAHNPSRIEITIVNIDAANPVYLAFATPPATGGEPQAGPAAPTAVANSGLKLAAGASWTSNSYRGPVAAIAVGGTVVCTVAEF